MAETVVHMHPLKILQCFTYSAPYGGHFTKRNVLPRNVVVIKCINLNEI